MAQDVERLKKLQQLVAEQERLIRRMIARGTPNQAPTKTVLAGSSRS